MNNRLTLKVSQSGSNDKQLIQARSNKENDSNQSNRSNSFRIIKQQSNRSSRSQQKTTRRIHQLKVGESLQCGHSLDDDLNHSKYCKVSFLVHEFIGQGQFNEIYRAQIQYDNNNEIIKQDNVLENHHYHNNKQLKINDNNRNNQLKTNDTKKNELSNINLSIPHFIAIKVNKPTTNFRSSEIQLQSLLSEAKILMNCQSCSYVARLYHCPTVNDRVFDINGKFRMNVPFISMELFLCDVSELRRRCHNVIIPTLAAIELSKEMLKSLMEIHNLGYLHRDLKPSNFALSRPQISNDFSTVHCYLFDFGQSTLLPTTGNGSSNVASSTISSTSLSGCDSSSFPINFAGTSLYCSLATHDGLPQGRVDDCWMFLHAAANSDYVLVCFQMRLFFLVAFNLNATCKLNINAFVFFSCF